MISDFSAWCEGFLAAVSPESGRVFPLVAEIYQNVPSIVIVQALPEDHVPMVIHIQSTGDPIFFVYLANAVERVAMLEQWLRIRVTFLAPYVLTFDGVVVTGAQDVPVVAGSVLHVRVRTRQELADPGSSTEGSGPSLGHQTHETWSSMSLGHEELSDRRILRIDEVSETQPRPADSSRTPDEQMEGEGEEVNLMQRVEIIDAQGRIHDQIIPHRRRDWLHDIEVFLPFLANVRTPEGEVQVADYCRA